ncbi:MAG: hypothetical protein HZA93_10400 [Verrucomicrobia bacterium]|nr:hypothetical protein [Verrucomicrobiota bacterium]
MQARSYQTLLASASFALSALQIVAQPADAPLLPLNELKPGQRGEVWTVFRGTQPEPFAVEVTGVVRNALGPGKSLILCQLTDPRVQNMGAVAGMSGSPLYVDGKLAGALSYQIQRFETVRYAGFTPAADLAEVQAKAAAPIRPIPVTQSDARPTDSAYKALQPVFTVSGLSPAVAELFAPQFAALGLAATALGGSDAGSLNSQPSTLNSSPLRPGGAVSVALATGDITLAGTGTVSKLDGQRVTAFGHPMLSLGEVELPLCAAEIVTILPSQMQSFKVANTGPVIGTISQDRLSAISGTLGPGPAMIDVEVNVSPVRSGKRSLKFAVARQQQLTPVLVAAGVTQAILGANDNGFASGFRLRSEITFPAGATKASRTAGKIATQSLFPGPQGFQQGLNEFVQGLAANLQNPYEKTFPDRVVFNLEPLAENPTVVIDQFQLSRSTARGGETIQILFAWRDWQSVERRETIDLPVDPAWTGKPLEVILAPGRALDELTGRPRLISAATLRSFDAYLAAIGDDRPNDGLCIAVVERAELFSDQTVGTPETPGSIERIARAADEARFQKRDALMPLWERHVLAGRLSSVLVRRALRVGE